MKQKNELKYGYSRIANMHQLQLKIFKATLTYEIYYFSHVRKKHPINRHHFQGSQDQDTPTITLFDYGTKMTFFFAFY